VRRERRAASVGKAGRRERASPDLSARTGANSVAGGLPARGRVHTQRIEMGHARTHEADSTERRLGRLSSQCIDNKALDFDATSIANLRAGLIPDL
jgi:hypothetical protein